MITGKVIAAVRITTGVSTGKLLMHKPAGSVRKELLGRLLKPPYRGLPDVVVQPEL
jgi:hypothetical protein